MTTNAHEVFHLSTAEVPRDLRFDYWSDVLSQCITPMSVASDDMRNFRASLSAASMGPLAVMEQYGSKQMSHRSVRDISHSSEDSFHLLLSLGSAWNFRHRGDARLRRHDVVLADSRYAYDIVIDSDYHFIHVKLPPSWLRTWIPDTDSLVGRRIPGDGVAGRALSNFIGRLSPELAVHAPLPGNVMSDQVGVLLAMATGELDMRSRAHESLRRRIADVVAQRCDEPGLCAADVAQTLNIPVRLLHEALAARGCGFAALVQRARTAAVVRQLSPEARSKPDGLPTP